MIQGLLPSPLFDGAPLNSSPLPGSMPVPDARTRTKISLNPSKVLSTSIPSRHLPRLFLSNILFVIAVHASKEWLLDFEVGVFWVVMRVLACGGFGVLIWEGFTGQVAKRKTIEWSVLGTGSLLLFVQSACLFTALYRLSSTRVILFTHFSAFWIGSLLNFTSQTRKAGAVGLAILLSVLSDSQLSATTFWRYIPGYGALLLHAVSSSALEHTIQILSPSLGSTFTISAITLGASIFALPFYLFRTVVLNSSPTPVLPLLSLAFIPVIAYSLLFLTPLTTRSLSHMSLTSQHFGTSYPLLALFSAVLGTLAFSKFPNWTDLFTAILLYAGMYPESIDAFTTAPRTPTSRLIRSYLKTILSNPESRKIFYFLMLNLSYMLVQMLYGVWTNSLGLISDAIHMAFDCMAIGVGLFASVMATWEPNECFTYGYGRIETLSGFANGIFLILISIFIVFEAIQRLLEPPEMNTSQLLLVSSLGLAVNLFGMFAMGGHHHHGGHSHSHGHSHGQSDSSRTSHAHTDDHSHSHASLPSRSHSHSHAHSPPPTIATHSHSHSHSAQSSPSPTLGHSHSSHSNSHSHSHHGHASSPDSLGQCEDHSHSHSAPSFHLDSQSESHSHSHSTEAHSHTHTSQPANGHDHTHGPSSTANVSEIHQGHNQSSKRHSHGPSMHISLNRDHNSSTNMSPISPDLMHSTDLTIPLTPNYTFGHDDHFLKHHDSAEHSPNVHKPSSPPSHEGHSHNMRGVFLHVMADTLGSVGVIISTLLIQFYGWTGFDPIASLFIAILIAASVFPLVMDTGKVLALDVSDRDLVIQQALAELCSIEGVASYAYPRFWPKDASSLIGSIHIHLVPSASSHDPMGPHSNVRTTYTRIDRVVERVDTLLRQRIPGLEELTLQVEGKQVSSPSTASSWRT